MRIGLLGKGKTGEFVQEVLSESLDHELIFALGRQESYDRELINSVDVLILFIPGDGLSDLLSKLKDIRVPIVSGVTGYNFESPEFLDWLQQKKISWLQASNFSLGVYGLKKLIESFNQISNLLRPYQLNLHEVHHTQKKDGPSGTAKSLAEWLEDSSQTKTKDDVSISFDRLGDEIGFHELSIECTNERLKLSHQALDRKLFAQGAIRACELYLSRPLKPEFIKYEDFLDQYIKEQGENYVLSP